MPTCCVCRNVLNFWHSHMPYIFGEGQVCSMVCSTSDTPDLSQHAVDESLHSSLSRGRYVAWCVVLLRQSAFDADFDSGERSPVSSAGSARYTLGRQKHNRSAARQDVVCNAELGCLGFCCMPDCRCHWSKQPIGCSLLLTGTCAREVLRHVNEQQQLAADAKSGGTRRLSGVRHHRQEAATLKLHAFQAISYDS